MTLRNKTLLMMAIVLPTYLIAIVLMIVIASNSSNAVHSFSVNTYQLDTAAHAIESDFNAYDGQMNAYVLATATTPGPLVSQSLANANQANKAIWADISLVQKLGGSNPQIAQSLAAVTSGLNGYQSFASQVISAATAGKFHQAAEIQSVSNNNATNTLVNGISSLKATIHQQVQADLSNVQTMQRTSVILAVSTGALILVAMLGAIFAVFTGVLRPILSMVSTMELITGSKDSLDRKLDLTRRLDLKRRDELGNLAASLDDLLDSITQTVQEIAASSTQTSSAAEQLSETSSVLNDTVDGTVERVMQISISAREVGDSVGIVSESTKQMYEAIQEISRGTSSATQVALNAVTSAKSAVAVISRLGESSKMIETVVQVITSIAEQTNLLALNATIEAARAGVAGKGFAVVASEVKDLAKKTSEATGEISKMIMTIQNDTGSAVGAIDEISAIISQINDLQTSIASAVEEQSVTTAEIKLSIDTAAANAHQIAEGIGDVEDGTNEVKATASATKSAAEDLAQLSDRLEQLVQKFEIAPTSTTKSFESKVDRRPRFGSLESHEKANSVSSGSHA